MIDSTNQINKFEEFIDLLYREKLYSNINKGRHYIAMDYIELAKFDSELAEELLELPEDTIKSAELALAHFDIANEQDFKIVPRFKNLPKNSFIPIHSIRSKHIDKMFVIEGVIKQKTSVRPLVTVARFECPSCGNLISVLQLTDKFKEPTKCGCGRKGKFREISKSTEDVFSMVVEENVEYMTGSKLERIHVLCKSDLASREVEKLIFQGCKVKITGVLKELAVNLRQGGKSTRLDWYLEANYIQVQDEIFSNLVWDSNDIVRFKELASKPDWLKILRKSIFHQLYGNDEECESIILQMFGGVSETTSQLDVRGDIHILLVGDPGVFKSSALKIAKKYHPKANYVAGKGASGRGLTASVVKDELLGGFALEAGAIVLASGGLLCLDEMDKLSHEDKEALHEPLSDSTVSINKANIQATLVAKTSVLAAANPSMGRYSEYENIFKQIELTATLINRFDLVLPIKESRYNANDDYNIAMKIMRRGHEEIELEYDRLFILKYIAYSKEINPSFTPDGEEYIAKLYSELKKRRRGIHTDVIPITPRNVDSLKRLSQSVARSRLRKEVTIDDIKLAYTKLMYSLEQVGLDPATGEVDEIFITGKDVGNIDLRVMMGKFIREKSQHELISGMEVVSEFTSRGITEEKIVAMINRMKQAGDLLEVKNDQYKWM